MKCAKLGDANIEVSKAGLGWLSFGKARTMAQKFQLITANSPNS